MYGTGIVRLGDALGGTVRRGIGVGAGGEGVEYFTTRNTLIVALVQVGVIVGGVLAAGACQKSYTGSGMTPPAALAALADYGLVALVLPAAWVTIALVARRRSEDPFVRMCAFGGGIVLTLLLALVFGQVVVRALVHPPGG